MDRASGSGVFARDPDALLDLIELELNDNILKQLENHAVCNVCKQYLDAHFKWQEDLSQDDLCSSYQMINYCENTLDKWQFQTLQKQIKDAKESVRQRTAWRIEGTLREFPKFEPVNLWFDYPVHSIDQTGALSDILLDDAAPPWKKALASRKPKEQKSKERKKSIMTAFEACEINEKVTISDLAEYLGVTEKTVRNRLKEHGGFLINDSEVKKKT